MVRRLVLVVVAFGVVAVAADLVVASIAFGPRYVWRVIAWRHEQPDDGTRFPARPVLASPNPLPFPVETQGTELVRTAFRDAGLAQAKPGETLEEFAARTHSTSLLVLRNGRLLYEGYFNGAARTTAVPSFSMAKSVTSLLIGLAIADGHITSLDEPVEKELPDAPGLRGSGITLRHLLSMTSGLRMDNSHPLGPLSVPWTDGRRSYFATDLHQVIHAVQSEAPPGMRFFYDDRNAIMLGAVLQRATGETVSAWLQQRLWQPMGAQYDASWNLDSKSGGFEKMESGINARPLDFLKLGELMRRGGVRPDGIRVLPQDWVEAAMRKPDTGPDHDTGDGGFYTLMWWGLRRASGPPDIFADGIFGQVLLISRANGVVILRTGTEESLSWPQVLARIADHLGKPSENPARPPS